MKKSFARKLSLFLVVALLVNVFAVAAVSNTSQAAKKKTHTVGNFTVKVPDSYSKTENDDGTNKQAFFVNQDPVSMILIQSTEVGSDINNKMIKKILKTTLKTLYSDNFKNMKFGKAKSGVGEAVVLKCTITDGTDSMPCRIYAVCKDGSMFLALTMGTSVKADKAILKSVKLK